MSKMTQTWKPIVFVIDDWKKVEHVLEGIVDYLPFEALEKILK